MTPNFSIKDNIATLHGTVPIQFVHRQSDDKPENHMLHINNYLELYVFVKGNHQYIVGNHIYELKRGDMILISPREVHKALPLEDGCSYERFYLLVDEHCLDGIEENPLPHILHALPQKGNLISPLPEVKEQILQLLYEISSTVKSGSGTSVGNFGTILKLMEICLRELSASHPTENAITAAPELLAKILVYVDKNIATLQTTEQVACALGISPQYLSTYFSKKLGTSLKIYIQAKKVALSKDLLEQGASVTTACFDSGFNDCSYFIKVFKKHTSFTPMQYQKNHLQKKRSPHTLHVP